MDDVVDVRLLDAIRSKPGNVLKHYVLATNITQEQGLVSIGRLIQSGRVKRHSHNERLSIPEAVEPVQPRRPGAFSARVGVPDPDVAPAAAVPLMTEPDVAKQTSSIPPSDSQLADVPTISSAPLQRRLALSDLHSRILATLYAKDRHMATTEIAADLDREARGLGTAMNTLREFDLVDRISVGNVGAKYWSLSDSGRSLAQQLNCGSEPAQSCDLASKSPYWPLTDEQMAEFRRLPGCFNDMLQAVHRAGFDAACQQFAPQWQDVLNTFDDIGVLIQRYANGVEAH